MSVYGTRLSLPAPTVRLWIKTGLCALLAVLLLWKGILPAWRTLNTDFPNYYLVARLVREGYSLDHVYDWIWLQRIKDHWGLQQQLVGFAGLTPPSALPLVPLTVFSALTAKRIWILINLAMLAATVELLHRATDLRRRFVWLVCLLAIVPLRTSFLYGQMHILVLLLLTASYAAYRRRHDVWCGGCIALAGALKVYPLLLLGYLLLRRRWLAALATVSVLMVVVAVSYATMGREIMHVYLTQQLPRTLQGEMLDPYNAGFASGASLLHRLLLFEPQANPHPRIDAPSLYAVLYPLWQMAIAVPLLTLLLRRPEQDRPAEMEWAAVLLASLVLSPVPSSYHFVVLILPVVLLLHSMLRRSASRLALAVIALYAAISLVDRTTVPGLPSVRFWLMLSLFVLSLAWLLRLRQQSTSPVTWRELTAATALGACAFVMSAAGYRHHLAGRTAEMNRRLSAAQTSYLATAPGATNDGIAYVAMQPVGYRVIDQHDKDVLPGSTDQLSFAVAPDGALLIEVADASGSRIVRSSDGVLLATDARSPAVSPDGRSMAYIREARGRGELHTMHFATAGEDAALTDTSYDVRQAAFLTDDELIFVAKHQERTKLFLVASGGVPEPFDPATGEIGELAVAPDGQRLAVTQLLHHRWQLTLIDRNTRQMQLLTDNDCNAYEPAWESADAIVYATDCGRGLGMTALAKVRPGDKK